MAGRKRPDTAREAELERELVNRDARIADLELRLGAADKQREETERQMVSLRNFKREYDQKIDRIAELEKELSQMKVEVVEKEIKTLELARSDSDRRAAAAEAAVNSKSALIRRYDASLIEANRKIAAAEAVACCKSSMVKDFETSLAEASRKTATAEAESNSKSIKIADLETALAEANRSAAAARASATTSTAHSIMNPATPFSCPMFTIPICTMFKGISGLSGERKSETVVERDCEWTFHIEKYKETHLAIYVNAEVVKGKNRNAPHFIANFSLLSHATGKSLYDDVMPLATAAEGPWGLNDFIEIKELLDPKKSYVEDDSIIVQVDITEVGVEAK